MGACVGVAAAALMAAACGNDHTAPGRPTYRQQLRQILIPLGSTLVKQTAAISRSPTPHLALIHIARLRSQLRSGARQLAQLEPPQRARAPHEQLVGALRQLAGELTTLTRPKRNAVRPFAAFAGAITRSSGLAATRVAVETLRRRGFLRQR